MIKDFLARDAFDLVSFMLGFLGFLVPSIPVFIRWRKRNLDQDEALFEVTKRFEAYRDARKKEIDALTAERDAQTARLARVDPERFIDQLDELERAGEFDDAETLAQEFTDAQSESIGRAAAVLTENRLIDSDKEGVAALEDALRFADVGLAARPGDKGLAALRQEAADRLELHRKGEPPEALMFDGMSDVELNSLAQKLVDQGKYKLAEVAAKRSVPLAIARTGKLSANAAGAIGAHGNTLRLMGFFAQAEGLYREALDILEATLPADHPNIALVRKNLAARPTTPD